MAIILGHLDDPQTAIQSHLGITLSTTSSTTLGPTLSPTSSTTSGTTSPSTTSPSTTSPSTGLNKKADEACLALSWDLQAYWTATKDVLRLAAIIYQKFDGPECIISDDHASLLQLAESVDCHEDFIRAAETLKLTPIALSQPISLALFYIAKPWGQEIWFTGIEERGVCQAENTPLPWILSLAPELVTGRPYGDPILLKILDPHGTPVYGDLYFEMHDKKQEVYVVTAIDENAWPDGKGAIRYGFDTDKIKSYSSPPAFLSAYKDAVAAYSKVRFTIDYQLDQISAASGASLDEVVAPATILQQLSSLPSTLLEEEQRLRTNMESFTHMRLLRQGDVIQVPPLTPHSLQHGVRVIEFQTPHYERYIISFAQKVVTQNHWDTDEALTKVNLTNPAEKITLLSDVCGCRIEEIISFDQFKAYRIVLQPGATHTIDLRTYSLITGLAGKLRVGNKQLHGEDSYYLTAIAPPLLIINLEQTASSFLLAIPS